MHSMTSLNEVAMGVYAVKVRAAGETAVAETLRNKGFEVLMPLVETRRQYSDRIKCTNRALFPGYVFVRLEGGTLLPLISTHGVSYLVRTGRAVEPISAEDLMKIKVLCNEVVDCEICEYLSVGQRVLVETGPLTGLTGVLTKIGGNSRIVLSISNIFRSVSVDVKDTKVSVLSN